MAVKLSVGLQKKTGLPDYGSLGASCHVEFEVDRSLLDQDLDGFHQYVNRAYAACQQAVNDQLARQSERVNRSNNGQPSNGIRRNGNTGSEYGNGQSHGHEPAPATQSQIRAIFAIARKQQLDPGSVVREWFNVERPEDLSIREASTLIDQLKNGKSEVRS